MLSLADRLCAFLEIVNSMPKCHVMAQDQPVRAPLAKGHTHASGVDKPDTADHPIELHVRVATYYNLYAEALKDWDELVFSRQSREDVHVVLRRGMAEED